MIASNSSLERSIIGDPPIWTILSWPGPGRKIQSSEGPLVKLRDDCRIRTTRGDWRATPCLLGVLFFPPSYLSYTLKLPLRLKGKEVEGSSRPYTEKFGRRNACPGPRSSRDHANRLCYNSGR